MSFDIDSLFTNVPINETIKTIKDTFFKFKEDSDLSCNKLKKNRALDSVYRYERKLDGMRWEYLKNY